MVTFTSLHGVAQEFPVLEPSRFVDDERENALVSAPHWLRGLQFVSLRSERLPRLVTFLPNNFGGGVICVEATTIDGRYATIAEYNVPVDMAKQAAELKYPTDFPEIWSLSSLEDSGVVVSVGGCDDSPAEAVPVLLPSVLNGVGSLKRTAQNEVTLVINIHARAAQEVLASLETSSGMINSTCHKLDVEEAIEFNFTCTAKIGVGETGLVEFRHRKISKGREKEGPTARILLPRFE